METKHKPCGRTVNSGMTVNYRLNDSLELINVKMLFTLITVLLLALNSWSVSGQNFCQAEFDVLKGRNVRSAPLDGTYYTLTLNNKGKTDTSFILTAENYNSNCSNVDGTSTNSNVTVTTQFMDVNKNPISKIDVKKGQTVKFLAHITVPQGTAINKWACTQLTAKSNNCINYKVNTVLHTLVINSSEE
ncbi:hypothetical protein NAT51_01805 [Flavobacterium amniphilum]|uniref:hypothetical protein n=1 Tax=Flavobacterium amniphilum TaxID=1834035 RepID=UPI00202A728B|nr:hypothetical protein [Flavobacterium amniphilum]MCL9804242.1 hypothetical protein [Flavobacterium amniphilum]